MLVSALAGQSIRRFRDARSKGTDDPDDRSQGQEEYLLGGSLALLALLLAFTFGLVLNRYEARRQLVTNEANAIGTAYLRADGGKKRGLLMFAMGRMLTLGLQLK